MQVGVYLFDLSLYDPVIVLWSCRAQSVNLYTLFMDRLLSYPYLIGINSIYVALLRYVHNVSFIVTAPLSYTEVVMYQ